MLRKKAKECLGIGNTVCARLSCDIMQHWQSLQLKFQQTILGEQLVLIYFENAYTTSPEICLAGTNNEDLARGAHRYTWPWNRDSSPSFFRE